MPGPNADIFTYAEYGTFEEFMERYSNEDIMKYETGAELENKYGYSLLQCALMGRKFETAVYLIEKGANVNAQDKHGRSVLHFIVNKPEEPCAKRITKMLLERGADPNVKADRGNNALWDACHFSCDRIYDLVELVLEYGGDVNSKNNRGISPLDMAYQRGYKKMIELLEAYNSDKAK